MNSEEGIVKQCSWCHPPKSPRHNPAASHGICLSCLKNEYPDIYKRMVDSVRPEAVAFGVDPELFLYDLHGACYDTVH